MTRTNSYLSLIASLLLLLFSIPGAQGKIQSNSSLTFGISSGSWSANVAAYNSNPTNTPYTITWTGSSRKQYALIALINNGIFSINSAQISFTSVKTNGDPTYPPSLTYELCSGTWDPVTFACSGTISSAGTGTAGSIEILKSIAPDSRVVIRLTNLRDVNFNYTTTLNALASRSDIRNALVTSS